MPSSGTKDDARAGAGAAVIDRHLFVIIGATGDLARRKLLPSLFRLVADHGIAAEAVVLGVATSELDDAAYRDWARDALAEAGLGGEIAAWCDDILHYQPVARAGDAYREVRRRIEQLEADHDLPGNRAFYLALPPAVFPVAIESLGEAGLAAGPGWTRLVVEKPFGHDLASARELNALVHRYFDESQVYRIDHYLGKETVQNLLVFRFANPLFERAWNRDHIGQVQITVAEDIGIGSRGDFYESAGATRDIVQNHVAQVLSLVAMQPPVRFDATEIRSEKLRVMRSVRPLGPGDVVFGQYTAGRVGGEEVAGYREEEGVAPDSATETFVAMRLHIDTWRWQGVPFHVRTGKRLPRRLTQVAVTFRPPPVCFFHGTADECAAEPNILYITLQPDEGFDLVFDVKAPGEATRVAPQVLDFRYDEAFGPLPAAYQTLLLDVMEGDQTLFVHADDVEASWRLFDPVLADPPATLPYPAGSWGPPDADALVRGMSHGWVVR